ncbi:ovarian-specific serine/threonine-protein kinase Lok [Lutzomyia longipalpis]|uniref:ovarian-specific serine/threonine-protein kinase Lok n=1 Tax=Lutzomyia longipalpis TaxID=7200 RepID=UPI0024844DDC|nr:ovarian-specific serine/threonine-protein kinase Lok [Lutzomyia longipalpis]
MVKGSNMQDSQACTQTQTQYYSESQNTQQTIVQRVTRNPWGRVIIHKMRPKVPQQHGSTQSSLNEFQSVGILSEHDLCEEEWTCGRLSEAHFTLSKNEMPEGEILKLSKIQFIIRRNLSHPLNPPIIEDKSTNGTFVGLSRVGKGRCRVLRNKDSISILMPKFTLFTFIDLHVNCTLELPPEIAQQYYVGPKLGAGGCGEVTKVFRVRCCTPFAMKIVKKCRFTENFGQSGATANTATRILNEIEILKKLQHPCVIEMHDIVDRPDAVYIFLELMNGGDLCHRITSDPKKYLTEEISRLYFLQTCYAVEYLHRNKITHRDLKPDNILLASNEMVTLVKVTDFGLSKFVQTDSVMKTMCGTPQYVAPEVLKPHTGAYTEKVDIWSLGVLLYTTLCGDFPFITRNGRRQANLGARFRRLTEAAKTVVYDCLRTEVDKRPAVSKLLTYKWLTHPGTIAQAKQLMHTHAQRTPRRASRDETTENVSQFHATVATTPVHQLSDSQFMEPPAKRIRIEYS